MVAGPMAQPTQLCQLRRQNRVDGWERELLQHGVEGVNRGGERSALAADMNVRVERPGEPQTLREPTVVVGLIIVCL